MLALRLKKVARMHLMISVVYSSKYFLITVSSVLTSLASMMRVTTTEIEAFTLGDQASDHYYLC